MSGDVTEAMLLKTSDSEAMCLTEAFTSTTGTPASAAVVARLCRSESQCTLQQAREAVTGLPSCQTAGWLGCHSLAQD